MTTVLLFIIILGFLVLVHELGHFLTARFFGVKAEEFGFGFPPRLFGVVYDDVKKRYRYVSGREEVTSPHTVYSLNWLPLGGFVRIKGEDGEEMSEDSFTSQVAWKRVVMLAAGVIMNFLTAIVLLAIVFFLGVRQPIDESEVSSYKDVSVQILQITPESAAQKIGLEPGDEIKSINGTQIGNLGDIKGTLEANRGKKVEFVVDRLGEQKTFKGVFQQVSPDDKFGIGYSHTAVVRYPFFESIIQGARSTWNVTGAIFSAFGGLIAGLFTGVKVSGADLTGPVGIVYITKQMSDLGLVYILQFAAILSINLAIINALPIPALDGGRILFILIEKLKGSPIKRSTEGLIHQIGFLLLIFLMVFITTRDILKFQIFQKLIDLFS